MSLCCLRLFFCCRRRLLCSHLRRIRCGILMLRLNLVLNTMLNLLVFFLVRVAILLMLRCLCPRVLALRLLGMCLLCYPSDPNFLLILIRLRSHRKYFLGLLELLGLFLGLISQSSRLLFLLGNRIHLLFYLGLVVQVGCWLLVVGCWWYRLCILRCRKFLRCRNR